MKKKLLFMKTNMAKTRRMRTPFLNLSIIALVIFAPLCGLLFGHQSKSSSENQPLASQSGVQPFIVGLRDFPESLDCHSSYAYSAVSLFQQFGEGLFKQYRAGPNILVSPQLAANYGVWNPNGTEYTISLRQDVSFHDGTHFNAAAVKWNFDRINNLISLGDDVLYDIFYPFHGLPVIENVTVIDPYTVRFFLNYPFASFPSLLAFEGTYMLSPENTPLNRVMQFETADNPIGTGPFYFYAVSIEDNEIRFMANSYYYGGKPEIEEMVFKYYPPWESTNALLNGEIHLVPELNYHYLPDIQTDPKLQTSGALTSVTTYHLGFNTENVPKIWRQAFSYVVDYDFMTLTEFENYAVIGTNPVAPGIPHRMPESGPKTNISHARQLILNDSVLGPIAADHGLDNLSTDTDWQLAAVNNPIATLNFTCAESYDLWILIGNEIREDLALLGVNLTTIVLPYETYFDIFYENPESRMKNVELFMSGWNVDYYSPLSSLYYLRNESAYNKMNYNDTVFQNLLYDAESTMDNSQREMKYYDIQEYLINESVPLIPIQYRTVYAAWHKNLNGFSPNGYNTLDFTDCTWTPIEDQGPIGLLGPDWDPTALIVIAILLFVGIFVVFLVIANSNRIGTPSNVQENAYKEPPWARTSVAQTISANKTYSPITRFCRECGTKLDQREQFCSFCGTRRLG